MTNKVCLDKKYSCKYCNNRFTSQTSMYRHIRMSCDEAKQAKLKKQEADNEIYERLRKLEEENAALKQDVSKLKSGNMTNTINGDVNINNGTINNITIVAYGKEDMSQIDREDIIKALKTGFNSTKCLTETIHFNPKYPHLSNIKRPNFNMKNKLMYHNGDQWVTTNDPHMIDDLYNRKRDFIETYLDDYVDGLTEADMKRLQRWLDIENDEDRRITRIKDELREILFNKRFISESNEQSLNTTVVNADSHDEECTDTLNKPQTKRRVIARRTGKYRKTIIKVK